MKASLLTVLPLVGLLTIGNLLYAKDKESITVTHFDSKDYIEVKTRTNTLRIYGCGKVDKLDWTEINPNEEGAPTADSGTILYFDGTGTYSLDGTTIEEAIIEIDPNT